MEENPNDKLIAENQEVGDGAGFYCTRNLYQKPDGSRYSVKLTPWKWIEQKVTK